MDIILNKAKEVEKENSFMNCRMFVQLMTGISAIEDQPLLDKQISGCILWWGNESYLHVALLLDDGKIIQVPEWGGKIEILNYEEVTSYWGNPDRIYKSSF